MKLLRYKSDNEESSWGVLNDDNLIQNLMGNPLGDFEIGSKLFDFSELHLLPPCEPKQVIASEKLSWGHRCRKKYGRTITILKSPHSICAATDHIHSYFTDAMAWGEPELVIVIGKKTFQASLSEAKQNIFGYTIANDVTAENLGSRDHHLLRSKGANSFCPLVTL